DADVHKYLADWVKSGGVLVYCGEDDDPYQKVMEWWNTNGNNYAAPADHLFKQLGIEAGTEDKSFAVGKGKVYVIRQNPKAFAMQAGTDAKYADIIKQAYESDAKAGKFLVKNNFYLKRGPYDIVAVMDEAVSNEPYTVTGPVIDLFDPKLPVLAKKVVAPGTQAFLYNINRIENKKTPKVLASASRIYNESVNGRSYSFTAKSPVNTINSMRIYLPFAPKTTVVTNTKGEKTTVENSWDKSSNTYYLSFDNDPDGISVSLSW
ncbi:MAG: hypothetical protein QM668_19320, partial [Agriterribacter sp.]